MGYLRKKLNYLKITLVGLIIVIYCVWTNNHQAHLISRQKRDNKSQLSRGTTKKYRTTFRSQNVYFPGDPLPEKQLDAIRNSSDTKLKRRLTNEQYEVLKNMLEEVVQVFIKDNIRYSWIQCDFHKSFKC